MHDRPKALDFPVSEQDASQIKELVAGLEAGFNQYDAAMFDRQFTADALFVTASGKRLLGWDEMYAYHKEALEGRQQGKQVRFSVLSLSFLSQDVAVAHTKQDYVHVPDGGANHGTVVMTRKNGAWWICAMQQTNVVAPPEDET